MSGTEPSAAEHNNPFVVEVEKGKDYFWCACGKSRSQPFCDGSHQGTEFRPLKYTAEKNQYVYFCGCKQTRTPPLCDGSHKDLKNL